MPTAGLTEVITYSNSRGEAFETSVHDILIQVFNHGTYHRAQVARDLRQHLLTPVNTDYITYVRALSRILIPLITHHLFGFYFRIGCFGCSSWGVKRSFFFFLRMTKETFLVEQDDHYADEDSRIRHVENRPQRHRLTA